MRYVKPSILTLILFLPLWGCSPDTPTGSSSEINNYPGELTKSEYDALSNEKKYEVANKLLTSMFKGITVADFYDLSQGMSSLRLSSKGENLIDNTKLAISRSLTQNERDFHDMLIMGYDEATSDRVVHGKFLVENNSGLVEDWPKHQPMARMYEFPLSKDMFDNYVAYVLVNTILFSPAEEIASASIRDVQKVFNKLYDDLRQNKSVHEVIARHMRTQENWRRFRSPEDNTREMIEIYLGLFDRDDDVPRAAKACKDLYLTDADENYELLSTGFTNTEPQYVLDTFVTTCGDFYDVVANHPLVIPRVATVLVEYFFYTKTAEARAKIVQNIISAKPTTFQGIVKSILFSREYLLNNERPKSFEESFFGLIHQTKWRPFRLMLQDMTLEPGDVTDSRRMRLSLANMRWPIMTLKLGRFSGVPLDALSFAYYHRALRETILADARDTSELNEACGSITIDEDNNHTSNAECDWREGMGLIEPAMPVYPDDIVSISPPLQQEYDKYDYDMTEYNRRMQIYNQVLDLSLGEYYDYLFMTALSRRASDVEKNDLTTLIRESKPDYIREDPVTLELYVYNNPADNRREHRTNYDEVAKIVFDYISRLPEAYYYRKIK